MKRSSWLVGFLVCCLFFFFSPRRSLFAVLLWCCKTDAFLAFADELESKSWRFETAGEGWMRAKPMPTSDVCSQPQSP